MSETPQPLRKWNVAYISMAGRFVHTEVEAAEERGVWDALFEGVYSADDPCDIISIEEAV